MATVEKEAAYAANTSIDDNGSDGFGQDEKDMSRMGKKQEFKRNFNWISKSPFAWTCR